jgi:SsrA-binding protein
MVKVKVAEKAKSNDRVIATNKKASHDYSLEEREEAGIVLLGSEVKSLRLGNVSLGDGYVEERGGELWLLNVHIADYPQANRFGHEPLRARKLLLHRKQIAELRGKMRERGYTIVPTKLYLKGGRAKVEIALARGKRKGDKRDAIAERDVRRDLERIKKGGRYEE